MAHIGSLPNMPDPTPVISFEILLNVFHDITIRN